MSVWYPLQEIKGVCAEQIALFKKISYQLMPISDEQIGNIFNILLGVLNVKMWGVRKTAIQF